MKNIKHNYRASVWNKVNTPLSESLDKSATSKLWLYVSKSVVPLGSIYHSTWANLTMITKLGFKNK